MSDKKIGYARVSTYEQNLDMQINALRDAGCEIIYSEKQSSGKELKELEKTFEYLREGDTFVVWKIDRLGRSLKQLIEKIEFLKENKVHFLSVVDKIDTTTPIGMFFFQITACFAEYERSLIRERTRSALKIAKLKGRTGGRPKGLSKVVLELGTKAKELYASENFSVNEVAEMLEMSKPTLYKLLKEMGVVLKTEK